MNTSNCFLLLTFLLFSFLISPSIAAKKSYVVLLGSHSHGLEVSEVDLDRVVDSHHKLLGSFLGSSKLAKDAIFYSYKKQINGFAAILDEEVAAELAKHPEVAAVLPNRGNKLHTTHSWDFMHLENDNGVIPAYSPWWRAKFGKDVIISNLDTGVWPESKSFGEQGIVGPVPKRWKGGCTDTTPDRVPCNRKLIGAKYFNKGFTAYLKSQNETANLAAVINSTRDYEGHGSHTLSTAGGSFVRGVNMFGTDLGTAKGGSPKARVAAYKVCWPLEDGGCFDSDIMEAFDHAIHDGTDVISLSVGGDPADYFDDSIAISSFQAVKKGIPVVCSGGNSGPGKETVSNTAPWILTVAASTLDRQFLAPVLLNNGHRYEGSSLSSAMAEEKQYDLITGTQAKAKHATVENATLCKPESLDHSKVKGKILVCMRGDTARVDKGEQAALAGAAGMILCNDKLSGFEIIADPHVLPASNINYNDGQALLSYMTSTKKPMGYLIPPSAKFNTKPNPTMAAFSSRGPNVITPEIIKPDVTAPGVNIIAAFTEAVSPTSEPYDNRTAPYITMSGTSMSCPHVAGVVGLLRSIYPHWSPAAIKSAIMTSARIRDNTNKPILDGGSPDLSDATVFAYGSGHIRPVGAADPGLVYDLSTNDYLEFLCASGYDQKSIKLFADGPFECPASASLLNFNYPSIAVKDLNGSVTVTRKLKNVGVPGTYVAKVRQPKGIRVLVKPSVLKFERVGEEKSFQLTVTGAVPKSHMVDGTLIWTDRKHFVRSPIAVFSS